MKKITQARRTEAKVREVHSECVRLIENDNFEALKAFLGKHPDVYVCDIIDTNGKTLLHECTFNDSLKCLEAVFELAKTQIAQTPSPNRMSIQSWVNMKDTGDGFTALHFASFKGNPDACDLLIDVGADIHVKNNFGINMLHVAAQGDQPLSIYYFKRKGLDMHSRDNRGSTPLHWAAYSQAEITLVYLLSWVNHLDDQDCDGNTPLHLAVKSAEQL